jgi:DNA-binding SARP family transcriptional activator
MRMQVKNGDRGEAVRAYMECKRLLQAELGVAPSEETEALYRETAG